MHIRMFAVVFACAALVACGGDSPGETTPPQPAPLTISPTTITVGAGTTSTFAASGGRTPYTFSIISGGGAIDSANGRYTAPSMSGAASVKVLDAAGSSAQSTITINPALQMYPGQITMTAGSGQRYRFAARDGVPPYSYSVTGPGSIDSTGLYIAGPTSGLAKVQARDGQGTVLTATVESIWVRTNGPVRAAVTDGANWYVGGDFTSLNPYEAARIIVMDAASGDPLLACNIQQGFDGAVRALAHSGTHIYVGGEFTHYKGQAANHLAKIDAATCTLDSAFDTSVGTNALVSSLALSGTALYIAGEFLTYRDSPALYLAKVDALSGALDTTFTQSSGVEGLSVRSVVATADAVYIAGPFDTYRGGQPAHGLAKLDPVTGALDTQFTQAGPFGGYGYALAIDGSSLYAVGQLLTYRGQTVGRLIKVDTTTGALDTQFSRADSFNSEPSAVAVSGSSVYVGGIFSSYRGTAVNNFVKLDKTTGDLNPRFDVGTGPDDIVLTIAAADSSVYVGGRFSTYNGKPARELVKLNAATGALDTQFTQPSGFDQAPFIPTYAVRALALNGSAIVVGGDFNMYRGTPAPHVAKFDMTTGAPDATFNDAIGADNNVFTLLLDGSSLYVGGAFTSYRNEPYRYMVKVSAATGTVDTTFSQPAGFEGNPVASLVLSGSSLYVGGAFSTYRGVYRPWIAKLNAVSGNLDPTFAPAFIFGDIVESIQVWNSSLFLGGHFYPSLKKVDASTGADDPVFGGRNTNSFADRLFVSGDRVYVGGNFEYYSGSPVNALARFSAIDGTLDAAFTQAPVFSAGSNVQAIAPSGSSIYVGGWFSAYRSTPVSSIVKLDAETGSLDTTFSQSEGADAIVRTIVPTSSGIWMGGDFKMYRGQRRYFFIPLDPATAQSLDP